MPFSWTDRRLVPKKLSTAVEGEAKQKKKSVWRALEHELTLARVDVALKMAATNGTYRMLLCVRGGGGWRVESVLRRRRRRCQKGRPAQQSPLPSTLLLVVESISNRRRKRRGSCEILSLCRCFVESLLLTVRLHAIVQWCHRRLPCHTIQQSLWTTTTTTTFVHAGCHNPRGLISFPEVNVVELPVGRCQ